MGRTKRKRTRASKTQNLSLNSDLSIINLRKWMTKNDWTDPLHLHLRIFPHTGRGLTAKKSVKRNETLIRIPLDLLVTYETIEKSSLLDTLEENEYTMHELLSLFLAVEKHKGKGSAYKCYIMSLPDPEPILPWLNPLEKISALPDDLKITAHKLRNNFLESFAKMRRSIIPTCLCQCCKKPLLCVIKENLFRWAYVLVNTRAVYVDPQLFKSLNTFKLSNAPSMALCPFLDMLNHDHLAETDVMIYKQQGRLFYELVTLKSYEKYEQIFIPYGAHSNEKLLMEYGFFLPDNHFDCVRFDIKEVLQICSFRLNESQYKYLKKHGFDSADIYINHAGCSFNLNAIIYVALNAGDKNISNVIFGDSYTPEFIVSSNSYRETLLKVKLRTFEDDFEKYTLVTDQDNTLTCAFLKYRVTYVRNLRINLEQNIL
ncbi:SET domain-containing protein 4 [Cylas formicarius]|uniref:SET domain-containing protein 4 n=1 Tax=Cylas formicarius TaxID=197179 RepID=UPI00295844C2|nr:SET domain-containing protein 4 [Cylas formicarius]